MTFRFVHTADWQIGKPFASFAAEKRGVLQLARFEAIDRIAAAARRAGAGHVLVAGDVLDGPELADGDLARVAGRLAADLRWHLLPGNHDPIGSQGVWPRFARLGLPDGVHVYLDRTPTEIERGVWLLPAPVRDVSGGEDPTAHCDTSATPEGALRLGLAHGSIRRFGGDADDDAVVPIAVDRARAAGLSYLALGDWHGTLEVSARTWYSGTPEPDRFVDNDAGNILSVALSGPSAPPVVEVVHTRHHVWLARQVRVEAVGDLAPVEDEVAALETAAGRALLRLDVTGRLEPAAMIQLEHRLARLEARLFHFERDRSTLALAVTPNTLAAFPAGAVREAAKRLAIIEEEGTSPRARHAARALALLAGMSREPAENS